eukprot:CAMPEP_0194165326 /NCGR_PEP_ID=MMETSP0154-20130528/1270_1 /TAXON_ID=1049557 /ORGANISM="Thalassiothrix antarctica, Strain L6-D1" /LENGTH=298 /DNA_ID=CAMNT_0038875727 /DNA_START=92 /DNA_END=988 /DNA_ORIENTATION=+
MMTAVSYIFFFFLAINTIEFSEAFGIVPPASLSFNNNNNNNAVVAPKTIKSYSNYRSITMMTSGDESIVSVDDMGRITYSTTSEEEEVKSEEQQKPTEEKETVPVAKKEEVSNNKKKKKKKAPPAPVAPIIIDISKLDIRVGVIQKAWEHEEADKLYCEEIDIGEETGPRQIASGLRAHYDSPEDLMGRRVCVLANLKTRKLVGFPSHGMVLCASSSDGIVRFVEPPAEAAVGERISVKGYEGEPATENQIVKKKMLNVIFPDLRTNDEGIATYKGEPLAVGEGVCKAEGALPNAEVS